MNQDRNDQIPANRPENKEPAEGSRETTGASDEAGGITYRPLEREEREQEEVPPREQRKDEARNATGSDRDPTMPQDDATLNTKI